MIELVKEWCLHYRKSSEPDHDFLLFGLEDSIQQHFWEITQEQDTTFVEMFNAREAQATWTFTRSTDDPAL